MKMKRLILFSMMLVVVSSTSAFGQQVVSLDEAISRAHRNSVEAQVASNQLKKAYWTHRTYKANLLPEVSFSATLPDFRRSYNPYQESDGSYKFVRTNSLQLSGEMSVEQNIWLTGGKVRLSSSLQYLDPLTKSLNRQFLSVPVGITLEQPLFGVNHIKWDRKIEPVKYKEAQAQYLNDVENVTLRAIQLYFSLLLSQENLKIAEQNLKNAQRIHEVAKARREMGQISQNELLQLELSALQAESRFTSAQSEHKASMFALTSFLGMSEQEQVMVDVPTDVGYPSISYDDVMNKAHANNPLLYSIRRRQLEADYQVAQAKGNLRQISLYASVGYTGQDLQFRPAYQNLIDYQVVQVGVKIPLLDWGKRKGQVRVAESNREVMSAQLKKEQIDFNQDLFLLVEKYNNQAEQLAIAKTSDEIAQKRYSTSVESFLIGKINTLDLADAQLSKDNARAKYINELFLYWYYFHQIRSLTLYDYQNDRDLERDFDRMIHE